MGISSGATFSSFFNRFFSLSLTISSLLGSTFFFFLGSALKRKGEVIQQHTLKSKYKQPSPDSIMLWTNKKIKRDSIRDTDGDTIGTITTKRF